MPKEKQNSSHVITMGGGTGTFTVLSGLRTLPNLSLTAIVTSSDDGGSTGRLRDAYGILPPGDARQALVALAEEDTMLRALFAHRFSKGDVSGHSLGNLFLTALASLLGSMPLAIEEASRILRIHGRVLCVSEQLGVLSARLKNGTLLTGEHVIDERVKGRSPISEIMLSKEAWISPEVRRTLLDADYIILGPGDLYTSTIATLLPAGVTTALAESKAKLIYITNLFTKAGQTEGYSASKHVAEVERYAKRPMDAIVISTDGFPEEALEQYAKEGEEQVKDDLGNSSRVTRGDYASVKIVEPLPEDPVPRSLIRHDPVKLGAVLATILTQG